MTQTIERKISKKSAEPRERIANDASKLHQTFSPGDVSHQGDLMIVAIDSLPRSARPRTNRQLADGSTQGSRHVLSRGDVYDADRDEVAALIARATKRAGRQCSVPAMLIGPVFVSPKSPTEDDLAHPEHGNQGFPARSVCAVVYQRNLDAEEREVRSRD